jgi:succinate dehydrogenase / fumarate reductase flavoprotein subunit
MYHQFKELAGIDITKEPMEVGPTTHYVMGGVRVDADSQMSCVPGLYAAGECAAGLHGANRLGGNSLSDLLVFGKRAGEYAAQFARQSGAVAIDEQQVQAAERHALLPVNRASGENPFQIQYDLQEMMQNLVGIVRIEKEMSQALDGLGKLRARAALAHAPGNREYNPGWHTALDLENLLLVSEAVTVSGLLRKESRGAHFRDDYPNKDAAAGSWNAVVKQGADGEMQVSTVPVEPMSDEIKRLVEELK